MFGNDNASTSRPHRASVVPCIPSPMKPESSKLKCDEGRYKDLIHRIDYLEKMNEQLLELAKIQAKDIAQLEKFMQLVIEQIGEQGTKDGDS